MKLFMGITTVEAQNALWLSQSKPSVVYGMDEEQRFEQAAKTKTLPNYRCNPVAMKPKMA